MVAARSSSTEGRDEEAEEEEEEGDDADVVDVDDRGRMFSTSSSVTRS